MSGFGSAHEAHILPRGFHEKDRNRRNKIYSYKLSMRVLTSRHLRVTVFVQELGKQISIHKRECSQSVLREFQDPLTSRSLRLS